MREILIIALLLAVTPVAARQSGVEPFAGESGYWRAQRDGLGEFVRIEQGLRSGTISPEVRDLYKKLHKEWFSGGLDRCMHRYGY